MRAVAAGITDVGLQRDHNEDCYAILSDQELFIVADGMGGHRAGDVASRMATESIVDFFRATATDDATWPFHFDARLSEEENRLLTGIRIANRQIIERSSRSRECQGMGTTVVGVLFSARKRKTFIGHVGDSRAYRVRQGQIEQLTRDHSLVNDYLLAMPELSEEQRSELPKNVITRALGMQENVAVDLESYDAEIGDVYVLCSDGLSGMIEDQEIQGVVAQHQDLMVACRKLVAMANEHGGEDNITVVIVRVEEGNRSTLRLTGVPSGGQLATPTAEEAADTPPAAEAAEADADTPPAGVEALPPAGIPPRTGE
jgi:serine/threonine protein phosphatase PrpC